MSDKKFNVGDVVQSTKCPTLIGVVEEVPYEDKDIILVETNGRRVMSPAAYWRVIRDLKRTEID